MKPFNLLLIALLLTNTYTFAGVSTQADLKVEKIFAGYESGEIFFSLDKAPTNPKNCTSPSNGYNVLAVDPAKSDTSQVMAILLNAKATQSKVEIQVYDDYCFKNHAVIRRIAIY